MADLQLNKQITISRVADNEYDSLAEFLSNFPGDKRTNAEWLRRLNYWWDQNPAYDLNWNRGFLLKDKTKIVGFVGSFPTNLLWNGKHVKAFNGTTWRVLPKYRKYSVDLWFENRKISAKFISFNTTPTEMLIKLIKRFKYEEIPWGSKKESFILLNLKILNSKWLNIFNSFFRVLSYLQFKKFKKKDNISIKDGINKTEIDKLWKESKDIYKCTNIRKFKDVEWYSIRKNVFSIYSDEEITGYFILMLTTEVNGIKKMKLVDIWLKDINVSTFREVVRFCYNFSLEEKVDVILFPYYNSILEKVYKKILFLNKPMNNFTHYYRIPKKMKTNDSISERYFVSLQGDFGV